jgi:hypothetical protein
METLIVYLSAAFAFSWIIGFSLTIVSALLYESLYLANSIGTKFIKHKKIKTANQATHFKNFVIVKRQN